VVSKVKVEDKVKVKLPAAGRIDKVKVEVKVKHLR